MREKIPGIASVVIVGTVIGASIGLCAFSLYSALNPEVDDPSGWWQVFLATLTIPIVLWELDRIRKTVSQNPKIVIGVASVKNLPLSEVRKAKTLLTTTTVDQGYAHFFLVIRNIGKVSAKHVKIHFEHKRSPSDQQTLYFPVIEISEFSEDKAGFTQENNVDFIFASGSNWILHPGDSEIFGFHITTVVVKQKEPREIREHPALGDCHLHCTVWAEGLDGPVCEQLTVQIIESESKCLQ